MVHILSLVIPLLSVFASVLESNASPFRRHGSFSTLSRGEISAFKPFTFYASAAYCQPDVIRNWSCEENCLANPKFIPIASGGDGVTVQFWYVGYDPVLQTVIVAHQGTDPSKLLPLITDVDLLLTPLSPTLFPGIPSTIFVHNGFAEAHAKTAVDVLAAVKTALALSGLTKVTLVGHSLGAALSLLESVYLPLHIHGLEIRMIGYGLPRVGNQAFASYVDAHVPVDHINNKEDPVPTLPTMVLGFHHPIGEKHIQDNNSWIACPGEDNPDKRCSTGDVLLLGNLSQHDGPYDGVTMGC